MYNQDTYTGASFLCEIVLPDCYGIAYLRFSFVIHQIRFMAGGRFYLKYLGQIWGKEFMSIPMLKFGHPGILSWVTNRELPMEQSFIHRAKLQLEKDA